MVDQMTPLPAGLAAFQYDSTAEEATPYVQAGTTYNSQGYPKREGAEQCQFFVKNGTCQFAATCKWHHPEFIYPGVDFNSRGFPLRPGFPDCEYYTKHQECKYGCTCKNNHPEMPVLPPNMVPKQQPMLGAAGRLAMGTTPATGMNSKGFPMRPGATPCSFYMKTETCKFGATCQFDHPEDTGLAGASIAANPLAGKFRAVPADSYNSKGYPLRVGAEICSFFAKTGECKFSATCKFDHTEGVEYEGAATAVNSLGYPLRPGQPPCAFYSKTGVCSYGPTCKFDHPEEYAVLNQGAEAPPKKPPVAPAVGFNSQGLPMRPGSQPCSFFLKTGSCSYGATCRWDHPEGLGGSQPQGIPQASVLAAAGVPERRFTPMPRAAPY